MTIMFLFTVHVYKIISLKGLKMHLGVQARKMINYVHGVIQLVEIDKVLQEVIKDETLMDICGYFMSIGGQAFHNLTSIWQ